MQCFSNLTVFRADAFASRFFQFSDPKSKNSSEKVRIISIVIPRNSKFNCEIGFFQNFLNFFEFFFEFLNLIEPALTEVVGKITGKTIVKVNKINSKIVN